MTIPRKKSRPIEVDGMKYRWMVRRAPGAVGVKPAIRLTVEDQKTMDIFQKNFDENRATDDYGDEAGLRNAVTPDDVREFIQSLQCPAK